MAIVTISTAERSNICNRPESSFTSNKDIVVSVAMTPYWLGSSRCVRSGMSARGMAPETMLDSM